jgi:hypothetical protein
MDNNNEIKEAGSYKMRPSIKMEAMKLIKEDPEVKSFNNLLEDLVKKYIYKAKKRNLKA